MNKTKLSVQEIKFELKNEIENASSKAYDNNEMMKIYKCDSAFGIHFMVEEYKRRRFWYIAQEDAFRRVMQFIEKYHKE